MASMAAIQLLIQNSFEEPCENHTPRSKNILRLESCDTICSRCFRGPEPAIKVIKSKERNAVWVDEIEGFVDHSLVRQTEVRGRRLIYLKANHPEDTCEENNYCSLACKVQMQNRVTKRRSGGRRRRLFDMHLPPKKRNRRA